MCVLYICGLNKLILTKAKYTVLFCSAVDCLKSFLKECYQFQGFFSIFFLENVDVCGEDYFMGYS